MKKVTFFFLLCLALAGTVKVQAQTFTTSLDSLVATFEVKNKKAIQVQPNTAIAKASAQRNADDLVYMLDKFFNTDQYRKAKSVKTIQYLLNTDLSKEGRTTDSFKSVVYILDIPTASFKHKYLKADTFLTVAPKPTKVPEKCYITCLDADRLMLISVFSPMFRDAAAAAQRQKNLEAYLIWLQQKYK